VFLGFIEKEGVVVKGAEGAVMHHSSAQTWSLMKMVYRAAR